MDKIKYEDGVLPPRGWILATLMPKGGRYWVNPQSLEQGTFQRFLSKEEKARIRSFYFLFNTFDSRPLEQWYYNFACDVTSNEILVYEAMAEAYRREIRLRKHTHSRLLYKAILTASMTGGSVENLLATHPELKALPNLARAVQAYKTAWAKRCHGPRN